MVAIAGAATQTDTSHLAINSKGFAAAKCGNGQAPTLNTGLGAPNGKLTAIAYCGKEIAPPAVIAKKVKIRAGRSKSATAQCPTGTAVAYGGFDADVGFSFGDPSVDVDGLERTSARTWKATARNTGQATGALTAIAYCTAAAHRHGLVEAKKTKLEPANVNSTVTAKCPRGKRVLAGGFEAEHYNPSEGELRLTGVRRTSGRGWSVSAFKELELPGKLTAIAYCG